MKEILTQNYNILPTQITPISGGFAALAFIVTCVNGERFFLKAYEKKRAITSRVTALIPHCAQVLLLLDKTSLSPDISVPLLTAAGDFTCADDEHIYMLYDIIEGSTIENEGLTLSYTSQLGDIIGRLHNFSPQENLDISVITENFDIAFAHSFEDFLINKVDSALPQMSEILSSRKEALLEKLAQLYRLQKDIIALNLPFVFCHTDVHSLNLMQTDGKLILIDWEGLKFAPAEADFFSFEGFEFFAEFFANYKKHRPDYEINQIALNFYNLRRGVEDAWEYVEQIENDSQQSYDLNETLNELIIECDNILAFIEN